MTLHYYSPKAYDFVRKILALPHPSSIRAWGASVDCSPGYLTNVIEMLGATVAKKSWMSDVVLIVDAMSLRKGTVWDLVSKKYVGTVDYGTALPESPDNLATEALVFMIVGVSGHFKHPIAYVLQDKCPGIVQAQLITDCLSLLHGVGINVIAVVFDGCPANITTAKRLGSKLKVDEIQPWFRHPKLPSSKVYLILDVCHMIKLLRNLLGDYKVLHTDNERKSLLRRSHAVLPSTNLTQHIIQPWGGISKVWGPSVKYGGVISQVWGGHQPSMGGSSTNYGGGHQPTMGGHQPSMGGPSAKYGGPSAKYGGVFSHQYVQEVKLQRITLATHTSCRL